MPNLPLGRGKHSTPAAQAPQYTALPCGINLGFRCSQNGLHNVRMHRIERPRSFLLIAVAAVLNYGCGPGPVTAATGQTIAVPAAPGSQGPNLAVGAEDILALSWLEPDADGHRLQYSVLQDSQWSKPVQVARGDDWFVNWADFPSVVPISGSLWAAHWLVRQPPGGYAYDVFFSVSSDGGVTWSDPVVPHDDGTPTEHGFVTLFPQPAGIGLVWLDGRNMAEEPSPANELQGMTLRSAVYSKELNIANEAVVDELICDCCQTDVALTADGPVAVYRDRTPDETRDIYAARFIDDAWQPGIPVADDGWTIPGCPVNGPVVEANGEQVAVAWFTAANDTQRVRLARSGNSGESFSTPVDVTEGEVFGRVGLALLADGGAAVSWLCKESDDSARVCLRRVSVDGHLGSVLVVSGEQHVSPLSVPQLARQGDHLIAAWTVRGENGTSIVSRRVPVESLL
jgi:hypothetical protein